MELLQTLLLGITITIGNFSYCDTNVGTYNKIGNEKPYIEICRTEKELRKFTILHELGHFFYYEYLTEEERQGYIYLYNQSGSNDFYRDYSKTNPDEDFADNFALYYLNKDTNGILYFKIIYIKSIINNYENRDTKK